VLEALMGDLDYLGARVLVGRSASGGSLFPLLLRPGVVPSAAGVVRVTARTGVGVGVGVVPSAAGVVRVTARAGVIVARAAEDNAPPL